MRELHLFAGAGGGILGGLLLGHTPVAAVEVEPFCQEVLLARQRDGCLPSFPIFGDIREFDGRPWRGCVDVVAGGFPCQDISVAGAGAGLSGARSGLWAEFARVIGEIRPRYAFIENSPALVSRGLGRVLADLAALGMDARWCVLGADDVRAPHIRKRIWVLADADAGGRDRRAWQFWQGGRAESADGGATMADADRAGLEVRQGVCGNDGPQCAPAVGGGRRQLEPRLGGTAHGLARWLDRSDPWADGWEDGTPRLARGVPRRTHRLRAIGNGQVPQAAAAAWRILAGEVSA